mgnify:CR=1 FL=1
MQIFNSMTRKKEEFIPLEEGKVKIYACGPTVYNFFHIGNARPFITFDVLRRQLEREGYEVTFVQNFTDIDDKMIRRANEEGTTVQELGERFIKEYFIDAAALGVRRATVHPKATEHIREIIDLVSRLIESGHAYATPAGDVYYRVSAFPGYGKLSGQSAVIIASADGLCQLVQNGGEGRLRFENGNHMPEGAASFHKLKQLGRHPIQAQDKKIGVLLRKRAVLQADGIEQQSISPGIKSNHVQTPAPWNSGVKSAAIRCLF